ncbi:MAG: ATP-binding protein [Candidatus Cyclonatronum sp.]|uniref:ATP-binding protein n=1 Tax=Cyclonatronum sp. TaxID=3024185 RepID=UPI0025BC4761|nr:ATP-binding protein [Cyclonatronum sp.]MCH8486400.1 ATP-binding protein [Cyclonatronum sp.]
MTEQPRFIEVAASTENLLAVRNFVARHARLHGFGEKDTEEIRLSVDEAMTNVIKHAYGYDDSKLIYVSVGSDERTFWVAIQDNGHAFDISSYTTPDVPQRIKNRQKGGVGVYLIKKLMDKVEYSSKGQHNEIRMIKNL